MKPKLTLTAGQQKALDDFLAFLMNPLEVAFVLEGYAGTGKSTLVRELLDRLPGFMQVMRSINPEAPDYTVQLTATTNKAADVLSQMSGMDVVTIHSFLGLRVHTDYQARPPKTTLRATTSEKKAYYLLFIDEASFSDLPLMRYVFSLTEHSKIVFMGDRAQLAPVGTNGVPPVFTAGFPGAMLTETMRQMVDGVPSSSPVTDLATAFRHVVNKEAKWPKIKPVPGFIEVLEPDEFNAAIQAEFTRSDWRYTDSKILAWTNQCVIDYNNRVSDATNGRPHLEVWDLAVNNKVVMSGSKKIKTDELVQITNIGPDCVEYDCPGNWIEVDHTMKVFFPKTRQDHKDAFNRAKAKENVRMMQVIDMEWIDLRHAYACTVNKSQGSTFDQVFIDLSNIMKCNSGDAIARMLYVATSRARTKVTFKKGP